MELRVIKSGSSGNCYILQNKNEALVIEAGAKLSEVKKALDFDITKIKGVLVSHAHSDHSGHASEFLRGGIDIFTSDDVINSFNGRIFPGEMIRISSEEMIRCGNFKIIPFDLIHDVPTLGFYINHPECGNVLFVTDTKYIPVNFHNVNHILVECNYDYDILVKNLELGIIERNRAQRVIDSHMSIKECVRFVKNSEISKLKNVILLHLSESNADKYEFTNRMQKETGAQTYVARAGLIVDVS